MRRPRRKRAQRREAKRRLEIQNAKQRKASLWSSVGLKQIGVGIGLSLLGWVLDQMGAPPEAVPVAVLFGLPLVAWGILEITPLKARLLTLHQGIRWAILSVVFVAILALSGIAYLTAGRSVRALQLGGYPKFRTTQRISAMSDSGVPCPDCHDELDLDGLGVLYVKAAGRGFLELGFSSTPTVEVESPAEHIVVPLPSAASRPPGAPHIPAAASNLPSPIPGNAVPITLHGSAAAGERPSISVDSVSMPPFKGTLKIRDLEAAYRFETAGVREHLVVVNERRFKVTLGATKEEPAPRGPHRVFSFTLSVAEQ